MNLLWKEDYHIHTKRCKHATGEMEEYVEQAIKSGFKEIAFTDHIPLPDRFDIAHRMDLSELESYVSDVYRLQRSYSEIKIILGIEADFIDGMERYLENIFMSFPFEVRILSVHFLAHWPEGNWVFKYNFPNKSLRQIYSEYLQSVNRGIETGFFNIVGHLDLIKQRHVSLLRDNENEVREIFKGAADKKMAIEINTSGLRKPIKETYPNLAFLPLIAAYGLPVTLGSDAHAPDQVGFAFDEIGEKVLRQKGLHKGRVLHGKIESTV